jgi:hypothetical protein
MNAEGAGHDEGRLSTHARYFRKARVAKDDLDCDAHQLRRLTALPGVRRRTMDAIVSIDRSLS